MLELKNINKCFGSLQVLDNVSATFGRGEVVSIVGPSGAGKTTLLQIAGTLDKPDSGSVVYDGVDVSAMPERKLSEFRNKRIGFVFQLHQLLPEFTGEQQRVAVARALINNPDVIFADEPSGSLDSHNKEELHRLFFDLRDRFNQTFVIVTHDEGLAAMCDRTLKMRDGRIIDQTTNYQQCDDCQ